MSNKLVHYTTYIIFIITCTSVVVASSISKQAIPVTTVKLSSVLVVPEVSVPATAISASDSVISSEVAGRIINIFPQVGDIVSKGDKLVEIECSENILDLEQKNTRTESLLAKVKLANWQVTRTKELVRNNNASKEMLLKYSTQLANANAELATHLISIKRAKKNVKNCNIIAPFTGVLTKKIAALGELAQPGTPIVSLLDTQKIEVAAELYTQQIMQLQNSKHITFVTENNSYPLRTRTIIPALDSRTRNQDARFTFIEQKALPGTAGRLTWHSNKKQLPASYIQQHNNELGFFIVTKQNVAKFIAISGAIEGQPADIDFSEEYKLITKGRYKVYNNAIVIVHNNA